MLASSAADAKSPSVRYGLRFGATPTSPIGPPVPCKMPSPGHTLCPYFEPDFVPNYQTVLPQTIRSCGGSFISFEPLTDGAERAYFDVEPDRATVVVGCIKQQVPNGKIEPPSDGRRP